MPLEHSEALADHQLLGTVLKQMWEKAKRSEDETGAKFVEKALEFEEKHVQPLREFGRYPWRNKWLGRETTEAERKWLEEGGDKFGTG